MNPTGRARTSTSSTLLVLLSCVAGFAGCASRTHLTPTHGRAYSEAFGHQTVNPHPSMDAHATQGLDSQEASAVARSYRHSLAAHDGGDGANQSMVITNPGAGAQASTPYLPPPSVPQGQ